MEGAEGRVLICKFFIPAVRQNAGWLVPVCIHLSSMYPLNISSLRATWLSPPPGIRDTGADLNTGPVQEKSTTDHQGGEGNLCLMREVIRGHFWRRWLWSWAL